MSSIKVSIPKSVRRHDAVFADAIDPMTPSSISISLARSRSQVLIFAEILGYAIDCGDVMD